MSGHTKGPWTIQKASVKVDGAWDFAIIDAEKNIIAEAFGRSAEAIYHDSDANARLIAAAPELLEACKAFVEGDESRFMPGYHDALAAIAKAEGR